uniref:Uncharacterized protein n=1 Tax=Knipowitschia caucasica TaxID=637954 RepID=A0AAV2MLU5_KNICA
MSLCLRADDPCSSQSAHSKMTCGGLQGSDSQVRSEEVTVYRNTNEPSEETQARDTEKHRESVGIKRQSLW